MKSTKTKAVLAITILFAAAVTACIARAAGTDAIRPTRISVDAFDTMNYDGELLDFSYSISSRCAATSHETYVELNVNKTSTAGKKIVNYISVNAYDEAPENGCGGGLDAVSVTSNVNLAKAIDKELNKWQGNGYKIASDFYVELPPLSRPVRGGRPGAIHANNSGNYYNGGKKSNPVTVPDQIKVSYVDYQAVWQCTLYKRDGARKDGFVGSGKTIDEARQGAVSGCNGTHNPYCQQYSTDPAHTTCGVDVQQLTRDEFVAPGALPANAVVSWGCLLKKNDGSKSDGFKGSAATEDAARDSAAQICKGTGAMGCDDYAFDTGHTTCEEAAMVAKPKPSVQWTCTLYKRDGSRKDGFAGTGATEADARNATISGCNSTNNPYCNQYALDPAHTPCQAELVYPQQ
jgi:hypothetical protein